MLSISVSLLTACGGGGGSDSNSGTDSSDTGTNTGTGTGTAVVGIQPLVPLTSEGTNIFQLRVVAIHLKFKLDLMGQLRL